MHRSFKRKWLKGFILGSYSFEKLLEFQRVRKAHLKGGFYSSLGADY